MKDKDINDALSPQRQDYPNKEYAPRNPSLREWKDREEQAKLFVEQIKQVQERSR